MIPLVVQNVFRRLSVEVFDSHKKLGSLSKVNKRQKSRGTLPLIVLGRRSHRVFSSVGSSSRRKFSYEFLVFYVTRASVYVRFSCSFVSGVSLVTLDGI